MEKEKIIQLAKEIANAGNIIAADKIPEIDLYMDQLTTFMEEKLRDTKRKPDDKILTKTMINNYSKDKILPPSKNKKYAREHMILLILVYHLKTSLAIGDIGALYKIICEKNDSLETIYAMFTKMQQIENEMLLPDITETLSQLESMNGNSGDELLALETVLCLVLEANVKKRLAEKIIDSLVQKKL